MSHDQLLKLAQDRGAARRLRDVPRQELIFTILKHRMKADGLMYGEGTLEILPDGFGFLRCPGLSLFVVS